MEKNNTAIIEEIRATIVRLREELGTLEERLSELDFDEPARDMEESPLDITLDDDMPQVEEPQETVVKPQFDFQLETLMEQEDRGEKVVEAVFEQAVEDAPKVFFESVMPDTLSWKRDVPGSAVQNILSAISLNDRVQYINVLFGGDPMLFQDTVRKFNSFSTLTEAENFIAAIFPKWKLDSDVVYRFMMAVRRKLN